MHGSRRRGDPAQVQCSDNRGKVRFLFKVFMMILEDSGALPFCQELFLRLSLLVSILEWVSVSLTCKRGPHGKIVSEVCRIRA